MASGFRKIEEIDLGNTRSVSIVIPWESRRDDIYDGEAHVAFPYAFSDEVDQAQIDLIDEKLNALKSSRTVSREDFKDFDRTVENCRKAMRSYPRESVGWCAFFVTGHDGMATRVEAAVNERLDEELQETRPRTF